MHYNISQFKYQEASRNALQDIYAFFTILKVVNAINLKRKKGVIKGKTIKWFCLKPKKIVLRT